jgi:hypothetical protein
VSGPSAKVEEAIAKCDEILKTLEEPFVIFVFEEHGCSISDGFCCTHHMKQNVVGMLLSTMTESTH